ncbi:hypothetical protein HEP87_59120 [Streptomyces sp. S1D4-11]
MGFFARPRGEPAEAAKESPPLMLAGMGLLAALCAALALVPGLLGDGLDRAVTAVGYAGTRPVSGGGLRVRLDQVSAQLSPLWVVAALTLALGAVMTTAGWAARRRQRRTQARLWDCGEEHPPRAWPTRPPRSPSRCSGSSTTCSRPSRMWTSRPYASRCISWSG